MNGRERVGQDRRPPEVHGVRRCCVAFRRSRSAAGTSTSSSSTTRAVDLAFELDVDEWRGRTRAQLIVRDVADARGATRTRRRRRSSTTCSRAPTRSSPARSTRASRMRRRFHTKLAGVTFEGRQEVLGATRAGHAAAARAAAGEPVRRQRLRAVRPARRPGRLLQPPARCGARARARRGRRVRRRGHRGHRRRGRAARSA